MVAKSDPVEIPQRSFRAEDSLWDAAMAKANGEDMTLSQVIRRFLTAYVR